MKKFKLFFIDRITNRKTYRVVRANSLLEALKKFDNNIYLEFIDFKVCDFNEK